MMKPIATLIQFLGSAYFAITLVLVSAVMVIAGTFLESATASHGFAAFHVYQNPIFYGILGCFFLNILISALRRWPFKKRHIPFLITHLGLLMILLGVIVKNLYGLQGIMEIIEGSGSHQVVIPHSYVLLLEDREEKKQYALHDPLPKTIKLLAFHPNSSEEILTWFKGDIGVIAGISPFPIYDLPEISSKLPISAHGKIVKSDPTPWSIFALRGFFGDEIAKRIENRSLVLIENPKKSTLTFIVKDRDGEITSKTIGKNALTTLVSYDNGFHGYYAFQKIGPLELECPISLKHDLIPPQKIVENNVPRIILASGTGKVSLRYDQTGKGLKWPIFNGMFLARFQPKSIEIPFHLRLREARQINYPDSNQTLSYECDLILTERESGKTSEHTLSMNRVLETAGGYRFYLSAIQMGNGSRLVQLTVNRDPVKYLLTYPGAFFVALGIILLFWLQPYKKNTYY